MCDMYTLAQVYLLWQCLYICDMWYVYCLCMCDMVLSYSWFVWLAPGWTIAGHFVVYPYGELG